LDTVPGSPEAPSRKGKNPTKRQSTPVGPASLAEALGRKTHTKRRKTLMRKIGIIAVLTLMALAIAAVPALAAKPGTGGTSGNPHYVGGGP
jgi:hypothetical protein